jgi:hypothetical protein
VNDDQQTWDKLYDQMLRGLLTYNEYLEELREQGFQFGINEGIAR